VKLYEYGMTRSARAHWVLREAGIGYEPVTVDLPGGEHKKPEFLAINPYGKLPVLVDGENGIIAGHGRVLAARKMGLETVPAIELAHLTEAQKRACILADNKLAE